LYPLAGGEAKALQQAEAGNQGGRGRLRRSGGRGEPTPPRCGGNTPAKRPEGALEPWRYAFLKSLRMAPGLHVALTPREFPEVKKEETMRNRWLFCATLALAVSLLSPTTLVAGDAFAKFGLFVHPDMGGFGNSWFISAGSDWGVFHEEQGFLGLEFQGAYHSESAGGFKVSEVPANVLLNFKWKAPSERVRPYAGAGVGLISSYVKVEAFGDSEHEWVKDAGMQFMGGVEFNRKFAVELMAQKVFAGDSGDIFEDGADLRWAVLAGILW